MSKPTKLKVVNAIHWTAIVLVLWFVVAAWMSDNVGGGTLAAIATVSALTAMLWAPILLVLAVLALMWEITYIKTTQRSWITLLLAPSFYVCAALLYVLSIIFVG